jgi:hypothetical protein
MYVESPNTINICLFLSTIYIFIPVSGCVGRCPSALLCLGAYDTVNMALITTDLNNLQKTVIFPWNEKKLSE